MLSNRQQSVEHSFISGRTCEANRRLERFPVDQYESLPSIGIGMDKKTVYKMMQAMDAIQPDVTTASIVTPVQFLQAWLPGFVYILTGARNIDLLIGLMTVGDWRDEQVVQGVLERTGTSVPYGDYTNVPLASWNTNFNAQTIVRFEEGMQVGILEQERSSLIRVNSASAKREAAALALDIQRNNVGFVGYNSGLGATYGLLNTLGLPAYVTVANGASTSPLWSTKTFLEIQKDLLSAIIALQTQSQDLINPELVDITLGVATNSVGWLGTTSDFGISVRQWLRETYPRIRVVSAPQFNSANGGANVFYLFADRIDDQVSTDDGRTFLQMVPTKFKMLGVQQNAKKYIEDYSNATAGVMLKRPFAVVRRSGI